MKTESHPNLLAAEGAVYRRKAAGQSKPNLTSELSVLLWHHTFI